jgi:hypothetical protein
MVQTSKLPQNSPQMHTPQQQQPQPTHAACTDLLNRLSGQAGRYSGSDGLADI